MVVDGARRLLRWKPDVVVGVHQRVLHRGRGPWRNAPRCKLRVGSASSTSLAFVEAVRAVDATDVDVISPYPAAATEAFLSPRMGISVGWAVPRPPKRPELRRTAPGTSALSADLPGVEPRADPGHRRLGIRAHLPSTGLRRPLVEVLVANQVTMWQAFRLAAMS